MRGDRPFADDLDAECPLLQWGDADRADGSLLSLAFPFLLPRRAGPHARPDRPNSAKEIDVPAANS
jgi:hypothetical protein